MVPDSDPPEVKEFESAVWAWKESARAEWWIDVYVGVCRVTIGLPGSHSLKDKRRTVRSVSDRLRHRFKISVWEVDGQEAWQRAVIGFSAVSHSERTAREVIESAADYAETLLFDVDVLDCDIDVIDMR